MKKNDVCELEVHDVRDLYTNFPNEDIGLNFFTLFKGKFEKPKKVTITVSVLNILNFNLKTLVGQEKIDHLLGMKAVATKFFKATDQTNNYERAAHQYG